MCVPVYMCAFMYACARLCVCRDLCMHVCFQGEVVMVINIVYSDLLELNSLTALGKKLFLSLVLLVRMLLCNRRMLKCLCAGG